MLPPSREKCYHHEASFFSFFGNLSPNNSGELTKKGNLLQISCGIKNAVEVVSLYSVVKTPSSFSTFENEQAYPYSSRWSSNPPTITRHEILQTKVKGYRESTYWGSEHPTQEKVRHMNDDEFDRFIENVELNDADVYWGAQYEYVAVKDAI